MGKTNGHGGARINTGRRNPQKKIEMKLSITLMSDQWNTVHGIAQFVGLGNGEVIKDMIKIVCYNMGKDKDAPIKWDSSDLKKDLITNSTTSYFKSLPPYLSKRRVQINLPYDLYEKLKELFGELITDETYGSLALIYGEYEENGNQRKHSEKHQAEPNDIPLYTFAIFTFFSFLEQSISTNIDITPYIEQPNLFFKTKKNNDKRIKKYLDWWQSLSSNMAEHDDNDVMDEELRKRLTKSS